MFMEASWPSKSEVAVTKRRGLLAPAMGECYGRQYFDVKRNPTTSRESREVGDVKSIDLQRRYRDPIAEARRQWIVHGWSDAAPGMAAVTTLVRAHQVIISRIEAELAPVGLTFARFEILRLLGFSRRGSLPMGKIGERLQVHPASVTSAVKRLERDGLLRRTASPEDNRIVIAELLPAGRATLDEATVRVNRIFEDLGPDPDQLEHLIELLAPVRRAAGDIVE